MHIHAMHRASEGSWRIDWMAEHGMEDLPMAGSGQFSIATAPLERINTA